MDGRKTITSQFLFDEDDSTLQQDPSIKDQVINRVVDEIFNTENIDVKTELTDKQIILFSRADIFAEVYNMPIVNTFTDHIKKKLISRKRGSRREMVDVVKNIDSGGMDAPKSDLISRLRGF